MPAQTVSDVSTAPLTQPALELLAGASVTFTATLLDERAGVFGLDVTPFTTFGVEGQGVKGPGTVVIGAHVLYIFVPDEGTELRIVRKDLIDALTTATAARVGAISWPLNTPAGRIESERREGFGWVIGIEVYASEAASSDGLGLGL